VQFASLFFRSAYQIGNKDLSAYRPLPGLCPAKPTAIGGNYARLCRMLLLRRPENNARCPKNNAHHHCRLGG
jgi:hypothetical protein